jgi:tetratricopeptide (TPR) repeat protein
VGDITDARGLALSAPDARAVERLEAVVDDIYYYRLGVGDRLDALLAEHPDFAMAQVQKGYSLMSEATLEVVPAARARLALAEALPATRRERLHQKALGGLIDQDLSAAAAAWEQILVEWPLDLLALRQHTAALFWTGDKRHQAEVSAGVATHWGEGTPGRGHFLSAHAFAMEEVGQYDVAERCAREALAIQPQDLWALHGLSHVFEMQGRVDEGVDRLGEAAQFLDDYNLFRGHLWWHLSLFRLSRGELDAALELFDREIYPQTSGFYLDVQNGASLLARLEFQGVDVGRERWARLAEGSVKTSTQTTQWFTPMHQVMALTRSGRLKDAEAALDYLARAAAGSAQAELARELSKAALAFCQGQPRKALDLMLALRQRHRELGASHAQQDLYDQIMVMAALELDDLPRVRQLLKARLTTRVWDAGTWQAFEDRSRRIDATADTEAVRAELRWAA